MADEIRQFNPNSTESKSAFRNLSSREIKMIDEALGAVGEFGEVRLVVDKGRLHFLIMQKSYDALKYRPGTINDRY